MKESNLSGKDLVIMILIMPLTYMWSGFIFTKLWGWFLQDATGFVMNIPLAIGILIMKFYLFSSKDEPKDNPWEQFFKSIIASLFVLLFGFIASKFV